MLKRLMEEKKELTERVEELEREMEERGPSGLIN